MLFHFQAWFQHLTRRQVVTQVEAWMARQGWEPDAGLRRRPQIQVPYEQGALEINVSAYTSGHVVWTLSCDRPTPSSKERFEDAVHHTMQQGGFSELLLAWGTSEAHPLLTHEQWRSHEPVTLSTLDEQTLRTTLLSPQDDAYWEHMGPRVHVLSDALVREHSSVPRLERILGVPGVRLASGHGFDCGWGARWGESSLRAMGFVATSPILH